MFCAAPAPPPLSPRLKILSQSGRGWDPAREASARYAFVEATGLEKPQTELERGLAKRLAGLKASQYRRGWDPANEASARYS